MHVGFVGTGNMGLPMAEHLLRAGHDLVVYDLRPEATRPLEAQGARRAVDLHAVAAAARVTFLSLPDAVAVAAAVLGTDRDPGLMAGARAGDIIFDLSTVEPDSTRRLAERAASAGVRLIDAPVSGSVGGARAGTLSVMIGAAAEEMADCDPLFRAIGTDIFYLGEVGRGNILKLLNNYVALTNQVALCEALALADRLGVRRETVAEVLCKSSGASFILERKRAALAAREYSPGFFLDLAHKDLTLALALAEEAEAPSTVGREAWRVYGRAREAGLGRLDSSGVLRLLEPAATR